MAWPRLGEEHDEDESWVCDIADDDHLQYINLATHMELFLENLDIKLEPLSVVEMMRTNYSQNLVAQKQELLVEERM